jgi:amino acid transporter
MPSELAAWMIGWDLILEYSMGVAAVAARWSAYFNSLLVQSVALHDRSARRRQDPGRQAHSRRHERVGARLGIWIAVGLAIYFVYGRFQSRLRHK